MYCTNCGTKLPDGAAFCQKCGNRIGAKAQPAATMPVAAAPKAVASDSKENASAPKAAAAAPKASAVVPNKSGAASKSFLLSGGLALVALVTGSMPWVYLTSRLSQLVATANSIGSVIGGSSYADVATSYGVWQFHDLAEMLRDVAHVVGVFSSSGDSLGQAAQALDLAYYIWLAGMVLTSAGVILGFMRQRPNSALRVGLILLICIACVFLFVVGGSSDLSQLIETAPLPVIVCAGAGIASVVSSKKVHA